MSFIQNTLAHAQECAYENALLSAYRRGIQITNEDEARNNKYTAEEKKTHNYLFQNLFIHCQSLNAHRDQFPSFHANTPLIIELLHEDYTHFGKQLVQHAPVPNLTLVFHNTVQTLLAFHLALLRATEQLLTIASPSAARALIHHDAPQLLAAHEHLVLISNSLPSPLQHLMSTGSAAQLTTFFTEGINTGFETAFFMRFVKNANSNQQNLNNNQYPNFSSQKMNLDFCF